MSSLYIFLHCLWVCTGGWSPDHKLTLFGGPWYRKLWNPWSKTQNLNSAAKISRQFLQRGLFKTVQSSSCRTWSLWLMPDCKRVPLTADSIPCEQPDGGRQPRAPQVYPHIWFRWGFMKVCCKQSRLTISVLGWKAIKSALLFLSVMRISTRFSEILPEL